MGWTAENSNLPVNHVTDFSIGGDDRVSFQGTLERSETPLASRLRNEARSLSGTTSQPTLKVGNAPNRSARN